MMPPLRQLAVSLMCIRTGLQLTGWGLLLAAAVLMGSACLGWIGGGGGNATLFLLCGAVLFVLLALLVAFVGLVIGFAGRCQCLACPEEFPRARAAVRLAVLLESCGWLHWFSSVAFCGMVGSGLVTLPWWVAGIGFAVSGVLVLGGLGFFVRFCHHLAVALDDPKATDTGIGGGVLLVGVGVMLCVVGVFYLSAGWGFLLWAVAVGLFGGANLAWSGTLQRLATGYKRLCPPSNNIRNPFEEEPPCEPPSDE